MTAETRLHALLAEAMRLADAKPMLRDFIGDHLTDLPYARPSPRTLPAVETFLRSELKTRPVTHPMVGAIRVAAHDLHWDQSYTEAQVGAAYLANYAWFNLVAPDGPFHHEGLRVSVGYWGKGLLYPRHAHEPEEVYCVLAGGATFQSGDQAPRAAGPGDVIHHPPNLPHSMDMTEMPLLAIAFWRGARLLQPSVLEAEA